jgi:hypothetical protein
MVIDRQPGIREETQMPKQKQVRRLLPLVKEVLFRDSDPIGVNDSELCRDEYDSYAGTFCRHVLEGADEYKLVTHLGRLQRDEMGLSIIDEDRDRRVVRTLLALANPRARS